MVDNRSTGVFGLSGSLNFKSGDISGTAAKTSDEKMGQGSEYFQMEQGEEQQEQKNQYTDRSAQLRATLNSLALMNVAGVIKHNKRPSILDQKEKRLTPKARKHSDEEFDDSEEN